MGNMQDWEISYEDNKIIKRLENKLAQIQQLIIDFDYADEDTYEDMYHRLVGKVDELLTNINDIVKAQ